MSKSIGFVNKLILIAQGICPACNRVGLQVSTLKSTNPEKEESAVRCTHCEWVETVDSWQRQATGEASVIRMRDDFLQLVAAYNECGDYKKAQDAQEMAIALNRFEDCHDITEIIWPAEVHVEDKWEKWLKRLEDVKKEPAPTNGN